MRRPTRRIALAALLGGLAIAALGAWPAAAQTLTLDLGDAEGSATGRILQLVALFTVLSLAPAILVMVTSFTRIVVVLSFMRTAIGLQQTPPNMVLVSLALFLTAFVMAPTLERAYEDGIRPLIEEQIPEDVAIERTIAPIRDFMLAHVRDQDLALFADLSRADEGEAAEPAEAAEAAATPPLRAIIPAFMISELRRAFEIGFLLFVPFLVIDMVVASILMSMGMLMLPPVLISLPFKLIFFVLVDGWYLVAGSLVESYTGG